jgi:trk system potassium uptake protein TrkH
LINGNLSIFSKDPECRVYLILVAFFIIVIALNIHGTIYERISESFRYSAFQVSSIITTTGFATTDFDKWPSFSKNILLLCMFIGAMAGSTGGGIKIMRISLLVKHAYVEIFKIIHPHAIKTVKLGKQAVPDEILNSIWGFFILYLVLVVMATLILSLIGLDMVSAFSSVAACIFNIGPGLGSVGPANNYHTIPLIGKWVLILCMLMGRLEIYTVFVLFLPEYWRK